MSRDHRRKKNNRSLAVRGASEKKYGSGRKSTKVASDTRRFKNSENPKLQGGPLFNIKPNKELRARLSNDSINIETGTNEPEYRVQTSNPDALGARIGTVRSTEYGHTYKRKTGHFPIPRFRVQGKSENVFRRRGIVTENRKNGTFTLTTFDLLYAYQIGILGRDGTRQETFKQTMDWATSNDPDFMEKYLVYMALRNANFIVVDGYEYGVTFAFIEPMPQQVINEIKKAPPEKVGPGREIAINSGGLVEVVPIGDNMRTNELIKGQHLATKNDLRYYAAQADGFRDDDGHIIRPGDGITIVLLKKDRLSKPFTDDVETLILNHPEAFEFEE